MATKIDLKKDLKHLYRPSARSVVQVDVPAFRFLMVDGKGDPNTSQDYADAVEALYSVSYTTKFMIKRGPTATDYGVMPLEGLWWADDMTVFTADDKARWQWTMMIMQPDFVAPETLQEAIETVRKKKSPAAIDNVRIETFEEGLSAQTLHVGPFTEEGPTIERVHEFIEANGELSGKHHEIYLTDIRRADPAKWKTIIRQPMQ